MLTFRLWRAMRYPPVSPLFKRAQNRHHTAQSWGFGWILASLFVIATTFMSGSILTTLISLMALIVLLPVMFLLIGGNLLGIYGAWHTSALISQYRQQGWQAYLGATTGGWAESTWATMLGVLHRDQRLPQAYKIVRYVAVFGLVTMTMTIALVTLSVIGTQDSIRAGQADERIIIELFPFFLMFAILYLDFMQSTILGGLIGILVGNVTLNPVDARLRALGIFALTQLTSYLMSFLLASVLQSALSTLLDQTLILSLLQGLALLLVIYSLRQAFIEGFIHAMNQQLELTADEWQNLLQS